MGLPDEPGATEDHAGLGGLFEPMELDLELPGKYMRTFRFGANLVPRRSEKGRKTKQLRRLHTP